MPTRPPSWLPRPGAPPTAGTASPTHFSIATRLPRPSGRELPVVVAQQKQRPRDAPREFERERSLHGEPAGIDARIGQAHEALGDVGAARRSYTLELRRHPEDQEAKAGQLRLTPK